MSLEGGLHGLEVTAEHFAEGLRVERLPEARRADEVREDHRDGLADLLGRFRRQRMAFRRNRTGENARDFLPRTPDRPSFG